MQIHKTEAKNTSSNTSDTPFEYMVSVWLVNSNVSILVVSINNEYYISIGFFKQLI